MKRQQTLGRASIFLNIWSCELKPSFYKAYCLVIIGICTLINVTSGSSGSGSSSRGWTSGSSGSSNWGGGGGGHK
ncbi:hypothetical protein C1H71_10970 [Iodobacter fluviatilis]|uniref:Uncharacterized protein n=1 Tax=Iodobacter fluviatilis TaxID=537 RepID=A0A7G3G9V0_9NEIS|nr:hypothetical protein C1H71_10970 [Iodobacter fluviatilis]